MISQIELLACPVCGRGLEAEPPRLVCPAGHSFDRARSGYVNLMTGRPSRRVGDTGEMVRARSRFLAMDVSSTSPMPWQRFRRG